MKDLAKLQDKVEGMAEQAINDEIAKLDGEFRELIRKYNHITCDVSFKVQDKDGKISYPYLIQLIRSEVVMAAIKEKYLSDFVSSMINKLLKK